MEESEYCSKQLNPVYKRLILLPNTFYSKLKTH